MKGRHILLCSTKKGSGKSAIAIGAFLKFKEHGINPGFFKPIGDSTTITPTNLTDKDVSVMSTVVARKFSKEQICPYFLNPMYYLDEVQSEEVPEIMEKILDAFEFMKSKTDLVLIEGNHDYLQYASIGMDDISMAKALGAKIIICSPVEDDNDLNLVKNAYDYCHLKGAEIGGVIISGLTTEADLRIEKHYIPYLQKQGITVIGGLKHSKQLENPSIAEIIDNIDGKLLSGEYIKIKNIKIERFVIGAMGAENAISYITQEKKAAIITGGDRTDIILAAIEMNIPLIILTGNLRPVAEVLAKAQAKQIPMVLTGGDTFRVTEKVQQIHTNIQPDEIELCFEQVDANLDWNKFTA